jgi:hypothetical protein
MWAQRSAMAATIDALTAHQEGTVGLCEMNDSSVFFTTEFLGGALIQP